MKENEGLTNLVAEIQSLPKPDYDIEFDRNKQTKIHDNLMKFSRGFKEKQRRGSLLKRITAGVASVAALIIFSVIFITMGDYANNATESRMATFEKFFHQKMEEMHKQRQEKDISYNLIHTEFNAVHEDDAIAVFIENNERGEQIFIAYIEKQHNQWEWRHTRGAEWNSPMNWSSMNQEPYIYSGALSDNSISEVYAGEERAKIITVEGNKRFWYAISPVSDVEVMVVTEDGVKKILEEYKFKTKDKTLFELTPKEKEVYKNFQRDLELKYLSDLEPISIAKLFVKAGYDKKYDVQYALYTDREGYVQWSKEEDKNIHESDRSSSEQTIKSFGNIDKGTFVQTSDFEGYIQYHSGEETKGFQMIKNEDGVWQVSFLPIQ
jgi:hypothetical protein